jgi:hypothetical protein
LTGGARLEAWISQPCSICALAPELNSAFTSAAEAEIFRGSQLHA